MVKKELEEVVRLDQYISCYLWKNSSDPGECIKAARDGLPVSIRSCHPHHVGPKGNRIIPACSGDGCAF